MASARSDTANCLGSVSRRATALRPACYTASELAAAVTQAPQVEGVADLVDALERLSGDLTAVDGDRFAGHRCGESGGAQAIAGLLRGLCAGQRGGIGVDLGDVAHLTEATDAPDPRPRYLAGGSQAVVPLRAHGTPPPAKAPHRAMKRATLAL